MSPSAVTPTRTAAPEHTITDLADLGDAWAIMRVVSHELRSPLQTIAASAEVLREQEPMGQAGRAALSRLERGIEAINARLRNLADYAVATQPPTEPNTDFDLAKLLHQLVDDHQEVAKANGSTVRVVLSTTAPTSLRADPMRLHQILSAFLFNAIVHAPGSPVEVDVEASELRPPPSYVPPPGSWVTIRVIDHGAGVSEASAAHVWKPFVRFGARTGTHNGQGIGLAVAGLLAHRAGWQRFVENTPGGGATFGVCLPTGATS